MTRKALACAVATERLMLMQRVLDGTLGDDGRCHLAELTARLQLLGAPVCGITMWALLP